MKRVIFLALLAAVAGWVAFGKQPPTFVLYSGQWLGVGGESHANVICVQGSSKVRINAADVSSVGSLSDGAATLRFRRSPDQISFSCGHAHR